FGHLEQFLNVFHLWDVEKITAQKISLHLYQGLALVTGQFVGKAAMRQIGSYQNQIPVSIIRNMAANLSLSRSPVHIHQLQLWVVVPAIVLVLITFIELLKGKRVSK